MFYVLLEGAINSTMCKSIADLSYYLMDTHTEVLIHLLTLGWGLLCASRTPPSRLAGGGWALRLAVRPVGRVVAGLGPLWAFGSGRVAVLRWFGSRLGRRAFPRGERIPCPQRSRGFSYMHLRLLGAIYDYSKTRHFR